MPGTNCQHETAFAFEQAGASPHILLLSDLLEGRARLQDADIVCLPGGFSFGDHGGAGNVAAWCLRTRLADQLEAIRQKPMICICNGFQVAVRAGLFGNASLAVNESGTFLNEPLQAHEVVADNPSPWLAGLQGQILRFPCAHGEGRFLFADREGWIPALRYPDGQNADGSSERIAGVTDPTGLVLGLMNHPERAPGSDASQLFVNAVQMVA